MKNMKKILILSLAALLLVAVSVGGTIAFLTDKTPAITNTFTESDVDIELTETTGTSYKMVPGATIGKDPKVTVVANSEACWVFVKIEKQNDVDTFLTYAVDDGWTLVPGYDNVYYREVAASGDAQAFSVLENDQVTVKPGVTKTQMDALNENNYPQLIFTAYAVQKEGFADAATAWTEASK